jgi:hypothetical protein
MRTGDYLIFFLYSFMMLYMFIDLFFLKQKIKYFLHDRFGKNGSFFGIILPFLVITTIIALLLNFKDTYDSIP